MEGSPAICNPINTQADHLDVEVDQQAYMQTGQLEVRK
jgi:hypothetical protein